MTKNHLKAIAAPRTWNIKRKATKYIIKPSAGSHDLNSSISLTFLMRNMLSVAKTLREVKNILFYKNVKINGKKVVKYDIPIGLMDIIELENRSYRILFNKKGKLYAKELGEGQNIRAVKIKNKKIVKKGKTQLNFTNGNNLIIKKDEYKTGDTLIINKKEISERIPIEKGSQIYLIGGRHIGDNGVLKDILNDKIIYEDNSKKSIETMKKYAFVIGKESIKIVV